MNFFKNTQGKDINTVFAWLNESKEWEFIDDRLSIIAPPSSDFFIDEEGPSYRDSAPFLYMTVSGDFSLTTRVNIDMIYTYDSACLMIMADSNNWAKLCYENWQDEPAIVSVVTKGMSDDCPTYKIGVTTPYLKVLQSGNCFGFHYSLEEK